MNEIIIRHVLPQDLIAYYEGLGFSHVRIQVHPRRRGMARNATCVAEVI